MTDSDHNVLPPSHRPPAVTRVESARSKLLAALEAVIATRDGRLLRRYLELRRRLPRR